LLMDKGELAEARRLLEQAIRHQQAALATYPTPARHRSLRNHLAHLAETLVRLGEHAEAARRAVKPVEMFPDNWQEYQQAADVLMRCALLAEKDAKLASAERQAVARTYAGRAKDLFEEAAKRSKDNPEALNSLAWTLATYPEPKLRDPTQAVQLAKKAVERVPGVGDYRNTLGVAHYRAGNWEAAVEALNQSVELRKGGDACDWFFLAMAHWKLGNKEKARTRHDQAVQWMDKNKPQDEELRRFRAEAAALLEVKEKKD